MRCDEDEAPPGGRVDAPYSVSVPQLRARGAAARGAGRPGEPGSRWDQAPGGGRDPQRNAIEWVPQIQYETYI